MLKRNSSLFILLTLLSGCQTTVVKDQQKTKMTEAAPISVQSTSVEIFGAKKPILQDNVVILDHKYFVVHYNKDYRLANYVEYKLTSDQIKKSRPGTRKDAFRADPLLNSMSIAAVVPTEYSRTGYDQGHLANSADFTFNSEANKATFVMTNMVPQKPDLNRHAWSKLEKQVRLWACGEEEINVISGPILTKDLKKLKSGLPIPEEFFKVVLDETPPKKMIAFVYTQKDNGKVAVEDRQIPWDKLKPQVKDQIEEKELALIADYPSSQITDWKSEDCIPKPKKKKSVAKK